MSGPKERGRARQSDGPSTLTGPQRSQRSTGCDAPPDPKMWQGRGWRPGSEPYRAEVWDPKRRKWGSAYPDDLWPVWAHLPFALRTLCAPPTLEQRLRREIARREELLWLAYNHGPAAQREQEQALRVLKGLLWEHEATSTTRE